MSECMYFFEQKFVDLCTLFIIDRKFSERDMLVKDSITDGMGRASNRLTVSCTVWTEAEKCSRFRLFLRLMISETALTPSTGQKSQPSLSVAEDSKRISMIHSIGRRENNLVTRFATGHFGSS